jgi:hypothetical protein
VHTVSAMGNAPMAVSFMSTLNGVAGITEYLVNYASCDYVENTRHERVGRVGVPSSI